MSRRSLRDSQNFTGLWRQPGNDERQISGSLEYTEKIVILELQDSFAASKQNPFPQLSGNDASYPVLHGSSTKGEALSLFNVMPFGRQFNAGSGGVRTPETASSVQLVVGAYLTPESPIKSVRLWIPGIETWLNRGNTTTEISTEDRSIMVRSGPGEPELTPIPAIDAVLEWGMSAGANRSQYPSITINCDGFVTIIPASPKPLEWFLDQIQTLNCLLTFVAGIPMSIKAIQAKLPNDRNVLDVLVCLRQVPEKTSFHLHEFLLNRAELGDAFQNVAAKWFSEAAALKIPSRLANGLMSWGVGDFYLEFLSSMQALEGFHRVKYPGTYTDEVSYEGIKKALNDAIPVSTENDHKEALKSKIRYGNQLSLRRRLKDLRGTLGDSLASGVFGGTGELPKRWVDTRNYLTHWDADLKAAALDGQDLYEATIRAQQFLRLLYLLLVGVPEGTLIASLQGFSTAAQHLIQLNHRRN